MRTLIGILSSAMLLSGCDVDLGGDVHAAALPSGSVSVPVGAAHDVLVAACRDEVSLSRLLTPVAATVIFAGFGRLDAAFYLPDALVQAAVPDCDPVDYTVIGAAIDGPFDLEPTANPSVFVVRSRAAGQGTFSATVEVDGERRVVETRFDARPIDRVVFAPSCERSGAPVAAPVETAVGVHAELYGDGVPLTGYGIEPVQGEGVRIEWGRSVSMTLDADVGRIELTSPHDPEYRQVLVGYRDADVDGVELRPSAEPWFMGVQQNLYATPMIGDVPSCVRFEGFTWRTDTPDVCRFAAPYDAMGHAGGATRLDALRAGMCVVDVSRPDGQALERIEMPVYAPVDLIAEPIGEGERVATVWARAADDMSMVTVDESARRSRVVHLRGGEVHSVDLPPDASPLAMHGVGDTAWIVGADGLVLRYTDDRIEPVDVPLVQGADLWAVWATAPDEVYIAGEGGLLVRLDGQGWHRIDAESDERIMALYGSEPGVLWVGGFDGPRRIVDGIVEVFEVPEGRNGGRHIRPDGEEVWFLGRISGPVAIGPDGVRVPDLPPDVPIFQVNDLHVRADGTRYLLAGSQLWVEMGPGDWLRVSAPDRDGQIRPTHGISQLLGVGDTLYVIIDRRLMRVPAPARD